MKNIRQIGAIMTIILSLVTACSKAQRPAGDEKVSLSGKKVLIVYLSRTNNTKAIAQIIQTKVGGTLVSLELVNPYPQNYQTIVQQVANENASGFLPPLKTKIDGIGQYDIIFLGFPTWGMQLPPPMKSFLKQYDLSGKTIVPFNTNAGYGIGSTFATVKELAPKSRVLDGFTTKGGIERDGIQFVMEGEKATLVTNEVGAWLKKLGLVN
ncbi:flavodoxin [Mucilaginibacter myungsuensis]|uniref:Flavodoxin n=1 Tax=Mucilaginibacter myungsuensis TaxID=649104 RepID=A0A929PY05_9SPHI|nr:flavodoxin [Mucilaginibacter myungsuensis]MBE9663726.1 flavodoxin [Mucilaginibacter myungsuensis]MDN3598950.1 flavodoxin [Mucilaginibacter myungsuensis]